MTRAGRRLIEDFLVPALNDGRYGDRLQWVDKENLYFSIKWSHKNAAKWSLEDTVVFQDWDRMKGHFHPEIKGYYMQAKQRFRAALYKLSTVRKIRSTDKQTQLYQLVFENEKRSPGCLIRPKSGDKIGEGIPTSVIRVNESYNPDKRPVVAKLDHQYAASEEVRDRLLPAHMYENSISPTSNGSTDSSAGNNSNNQTLTAKIGCGPVVVMTQFPSPMPHRPYPKILIRPRHNIIVKPPPSLFVRPRPKVEFPSRPKIDGWMDPVMNGQSRHKNQHRSQVNAQSDINGQSCPVMNSQSQQKASDQPHPLINGQPKVNGSAHPLINGSAHPQMNDQTLPVINGQSRLQFNGQSQPEMDFHIPPEVDIKPSIRVEEEPHIQTIDERTSLRMVVGEPLDVKPPLSSLIPIPPPPPQLPVRPPPQVSISRPVPITRYSQSTVVSKVSKNIYSRPYNQRHIPVQVLPASPKPGTYLQSQVQQMSPLYPLTVQLAKKQQLEAVGKAPTDGSEGALNLTIKAEPNVDPSDWQSMPVFSRDNGDCFFSALGLLRIVRVKSPPRDDNW